MALNGNMTQTLNVFKGAAIGFHSLNSVVADVQNAVGGIVDPGANAELQLINMKTLFGGNAEAAKEMYDRIRSMAR